MARKSRKNVVVVETPLRIAEYIRTAEYIRLSVEDSNHKGNSIETQKLILDDYIARNANMRLYDTYIDNGATGTNFNRPDFQRMINDIENGKIDCVIVKDLSRLGRNSIDTGFYIERYFADKNIRFIAVTDNFDTANPDKNAGMMLHLKNIINEAYALDISKKIRTQARQAMRDGQYVSARPRYGYLKDPNDCHKLIINSEVAYIVKQIFEWFVNGMSYNEIALQLNNRKILTPSVYGYQKGYITTKKSVGNGLWQTRTIFNILSEPIYTGSLVQGKSQTVAKKQVKVKDKSKWIVAENTHEAIIGKELFDKAQMRIAELKDNHSQKAIKPYTENILKGKIFCGHCGRGLNRQRQLRRTMADKYAFYCMTNTRYERGGCDNGSIFEEEIISVIITSLKAQANVLVDKKNMLLCSLSDKCRMENDAAEIKSLKRYIEKNQNFLGGLYESLINNIISAEEYQNMRNDYNNKISDAVKKIHDIEIQQQELEKQYNYYCDLSDAADDIIKNNNLTRELVEKLIDKIIVYKGKRVEIIFSFNNEFEEVCVNG